MSKYTDGLHCFEHISGIDFKTKTEISWYLDEEFTVLVPADFIFNVSIPVGLRWLFNPRDKRYLKAAALHDFLLAKGWSRLVAGGVFHDALRADEVSIVTRLLMWFAVSLWKYSTDGRQGDLNGKE